MKTIINTRGMKKDKVSEELVSKYNLKYLDGYKYKSMRILDLEVLCGLKTEKEKKEYLDFFNDFSLSYFNYRISAISFFDDPYRNKVFGYDTFIETGKDGKQVKNVSLPKNAYLENVLRVSGISFVELLNGGVGVLDQNGKKYFVKFDGLRFDLLTIQKEYSNKNDMFDLEFYSKLGNKINRYLYLRHFDLEKLKLGIVLKPFYYEIGKEDEYFEKYKKGESAMAFVSDTENFEVDFYEGLNLLVKKSDVLASKKLILDFFKENNIEIKEEIDVHLKPLFSYKKLLYVEQKKEINEEKTYVIPAFVDCESGKTYYDLSFICPKKF